MSAIQPDLTVSCDLCGEARGRFLVAGNRFDIRATIVTCPRCGLVYQNPRMSQDQLREFYEKDYRDLYSGDNETPDAEFVRQQTEKGRRILDFVRDRLRPGARILDVGCGAGATLLPFKEAGLEVRGLEPSPYGRWGREHLGLDIREETLEAVAPDPGQADCVLFAFVLEHVPSPMATLKKARAILSPGGLVYVEVPDLRGINAPASRYFHVAHLTYFTPATMEATLRAAGFAPLRAESGRGYSLRVLAERVAEGVAPPAEPLDKPEDLEGLLREHEARSAKSEKARRVLKPFFRAGLWTLSLLIGRANGEKLLNRCRAWWAGWWYPRRPGKAETEGPR